MASVDFSYEISDEHLLTYSRLPIMDRLRWLDEVRIFTLMVRQAPTVQREAQNSGSQSKNPPEPKIG
ncbi:MAG: hypothetical protein Q8O37_02035 [Sulfuricellaceae bacterium]|nr:hypothetical protein [Sulfuricellaceae bacterium]